MKITLFILIFISFISDIYFLKLESNSNINIYWVCFQLFNVFTGIYCIYKLIKHKADIAVRVNFNNLSWILFGLIVSTLLASLIMALNKTSFDWDAVGLYDARAKFIEYGIPFSKMLDLSADDDLNSYYYLLYPPYTSILHSFWSLLNFEIPTAVIYSGFLIILASSLYFLTKNILGVNFSLMLALLSISYKNIFTMSIFEYTNLPYAVFVVCGVLLICKYLIENKLYNLYIGAYFISVSQFIRFSEPAFISLLLASLFSLVFFKTRKYFNIVLALVIIGGFRYISWQYFTNDVVKVPNYTNINSITLLEAMLGGLIGSLIDYTRVFVASFYPLIIPVAASVIIPFKKINLLQNNEDILFIKIFILITTIAYFTGFYLLSFSTDWWRSALSESLIRSVIYMIPLAIYIFIRLFKRQIENVSS